VRSSLFQLAVFCSPADRYCTACCGRLVQTDSVIVTLQTKTARLFAAIWFQPAVVLLPADRYSMTRCGQLVALSFIRLFVSLQTVRPTAGLVAASVFQLAVF
jgi:hypothetical protein